MADDEKPQYTVIGEDGKTIATVQLPEGSKVIESRGMIEFRDRQTVLGVVAASGGPLVIRSDLIVAAASSTPKIPPPPTTK